MKRASMNEALAACSMAALIIIGGAGCENLPGSPGTQGAAIGGVGGAAAGAAIAGEDNRLLGALLGGAIGAGGGYLIGANSDKIMNQDKAGAERAVQTAQSAPATAQQAANAATADVNNDGFVTLDEVIAMEQAGLSDQAMIDRLRATGQVFELTASQQDQLRQHGVSNDVIAQMSNLNRQAGFGESQRGGVISQPPPTGR